MDIDYEFAFDLELQDQFQNQIEPRQSQEKKIFAGLVSDSEEFNRQKCSSGKIKQFQVQREETKYDSGIQPNQSSSAVEFSFSYPKQNSGFKPPKPFQQSNKISFEQQNKRQKVYDDYTRTNHYSKQNNPYQHFRTPYHKKQNNHNKKSQKTKDCQDDQQSYLIQKSIDNKLGNFETSSCMTIGMKNPESPSRSLTKSQLSLTHKQRSSQSDLRNKTSAAAVEERQKQQSLQRIFGYVHIEFLKDSGYRIKKIPQLQFEYYVNKMLQSLNESTANLMKELNFFEVKKHIQNFRILGPQVYEYVFGQKFLNEQEMIDHINSIRFPILRGELNFFNGSYDIKIHTKEDYLNHLFFHIEKFVKKYKIDHHKIITKLCTQSLDKRNFEKFNKRFSKMSDDKSYSRRNNSKSNLSRGRQSSVESRDGRSVKSETNSRYRRRSIERSTRQSNRKMDSKSDYSNRQKFSVRMRFDDEDKSLNRSAQSRGREKRYGSEYSRIASPMSFKYSMKFDQDDDEDGASFSQDDIVENPSFRTMTRRYSGQVPLIVQPRNMFLGKRKNLREIINQDKTLEIYNSTTFSKVSCFECSQYGRKRDVKRQRKTVKFYDGLEIEENSQKSSDDIFDRLQSSQSKNQSKKVIQDINAICKNSNRSQCSSQRNSYHRNHSTQSKSSRMSYSARNFHPKQDYSSQFGRPQSILKKY